MPNPQIGLLVPPSLPAGYCYPADPQQFANDLFSLASVVSVTSTTIEQYYNKGNSTPTAAFQSYPWLKLDVNGAPISWYVFYNGEWVWPHSVLPNDDELRLYRGTEVALLLKDRPGENPGDPLTASTGPFWEVDHDFDGRFPIGPGSIPTSSPPATVAIGAETDSNLVSGEYAHTLTLPEIPEHDHGLDGKNVWVTGAGTPDIDGNGGIPVAFESDGGDQPHNNMPPYRAVFFIKRTSRVFYRGA